MRSYFWNHELRVPLSTLAAASALGTVLIVARAVMTRHGPQLYLVWNLFLAWVPVMLALRVEAIDRSARDWRFWSMFVAWLIFFPNAPYLFTDLTHLKFPVRPRWWTDLLIILLFAIIGMVLAFISLHRMQQLVVRRRGRIAGWLFVSVVAFMSGFGVYLGRFERWNSWDVVVNPIGLVSDSVNWLHLNSLKFTLLFGTFLFTAYALLYSLTALGSPPRSASLPRGGYV